MRSVSERAGMMIVVVLVLGLALPVLTYPPGRDQGEFATIGRGILEGRVPYVDLWNPKPPAVFYVYAGAIGLLGPTAASLRVIDLVLFALAAPLIGGLNLWPGRRRTALLATLAFGAYYFTEDFWTLTQNDGIVLLPMLLAAFSTRRARAAEGWQWMLLAGAACGVVFWFKYPFALFALALAVDYLLGGRGMPDAARRPFWQGGMAFAAGAGLVVALGAGYYAAVGALDALVESALVTARYTALGTGSASLSEATVLRAGLVLRLARWWPLLLLAGAWWALPGRESWRGGWRLVWLWLLAGGAIVAVQAKGYDYHFLPALPPLILIGVDSLLRLAGWLGDRSRWGRERCLNRAAGLVAGGLVLAMIVAIWLPAWPYLTGQQSRDTYLARFQGGEFVADESARMVAYLQERAAAGDSLFIWGNRPEVYYLSGLRPATRFIFNFPLVADWYPPTWQQQTVEVLWAALPPYVLILRGDFMPWVTGFDADSNTLLQDFTELNNWLMYNYEPETEIGNFLVWRRKVG